MAGEFEALDDLYREVILDHYKSPRHHEQVMPHDVQQEGFNPLCGDQIVIQLKFVGHQIERIGFSGKGCSISQASASILTEEVEGKSLEEVQKKIDLFKQMMHGKLDPATIESLGDLEALSGVQKFPVRIKCALLAWTTLEEAFDFYLKKGG
ncbi:MAG: Fe-S cluster assembly sulfur transfer protein SufU [Deltaproteobacteria bacterium]